jgi:hypothetical protein
VHGLLVVYVLLLVFLLFQNVDEARQFLRVRNLRVFGAAGAGAEVEGALYLGRRGIARAWVHRAARGASVSRRGL